MQIRLKQVGIEPNMYESSEIGRFNPYFLSSCLSFKNKLDVLYHHPHSSIQPFSFKNDSHACTSHEQLNVIKSMQHCMENDMKGPTK